MYMAIIVLSEYTYLTKESYRKFQNAKSQFIPLTGTKGKHENHSSSMGKHLA